MRLKWGDSGRRFVSGRSYEEKIGTELFAQVSLIGEVRQQCEWAAYHFGSLRQNIAESTKRLGVREFGEYQRYRSLAFADVQAFLTCAAIVDSIVSGSGLPPPKGLEPVSPETRKAIRHRLELPADFQVPGRVQRNGLIHIAERVLPWSRPDRMRGDFLTGIHPEMTEEQLAEVLRALDFETLRFAVLGESCELSQVASALTQLHLASGSAIGELLKEMHRRGSASDGTV